MYSWRFIRTICVVLLALPIVHVAYLLSRDVSEMMDPSPEAFQRDLEAYQRQDELAERPENPVVVVGGRRVKLWHDLEQMLAPRPVLMRGIGDAIVEDITANYPHLIGIYNPGSVILLTGGSEFMVRASKSATELFATIQELVELDASQGGAERFYVISPIKTPFRPQDDQVIDDTMQMLTDWAPTHSHVSILNINALLAGADGRPDPSFFRGDGMQLNEHGYLRLTVLLQSELDRQQPLDEPSQQ